MFFFIFAILINVQSSYRGTRYSERHLFFFSYLLGVSVRGYIFGSRIEGTISNSKNSLDKIQC